MSESKACKKCGIVKPLADFYQDRSLPDGRRNSCIKCDKARKRTDEVREQSHRYYHSEKGKAAERRYYHEGKGRETRKEYNDRTDVKERRKPHRSEAVLKYLKTEKGREWSRQYQASEKRQAWKKEYSQRPEVAEQIRTRARRNVQKRLNLSRNLPATLTDAEWHSALAYFEYRCAYCGAADRLQQEHFIPLSKGGGYTASNIVPACPRCNFSKHDKMPEEWCDSDAYRRIVTYLESMCTND